MNWSIVALAAVVGYLCGSVSFARLVARMAAPQQDISRLELAVPDSDIRIESDAVSATTVGFHAGQAYGCLTGALDILKAAVPALAFKLWQPDAPYYLIVAGMVTVGHNWPLYYRFRGGRGLSPVTGGLLVLDWLGVLITNLIGVPIGLLVEDAFVVSGAGTILMIPWIWFRTHDGPELIYVIAMNVLYWTSMMPELREDLRLRRQGIYKQFARAGQLRVMTRGDRGLVPQITVPGIIARIRSLFS